MEKIFYIVCNFTTAHWLMSEANRYETLEAAEVEATRLAEKYKNHEYHVLQAVKVVRQPRPKVEIMELK